MALVAEKDVWRSIRESRFDRVYYLFGDDDFRKEAFARAVVKSALDEATGAFNHEILRGGEVSAETLDTALSTPAMFAERRVVEVRETHALKKPAHAVLSRYARNPASDVVLLLVDSAGEKADAALSALATCVSFDRVEDRRIPGWIVKHAAAELGVKVTEGAAALLHETVGSDLSSLASELDKLASFTGGQTIDEAAVRGVVGVRHGESVPDLLDAVAERDARKALALLPLVLQQPKVNAVTLIMSIATQTTAIAWGRAARDRGVPAAGMERGFYTLLKEGRAFPGRAWKEAVTCWHRAVPRWTDAELDQALRQLLMADAAAKESRVSSDEQLLTSLILALCTPRRRAA